MARVTMLRPDRAVVLMCLCAVGTVAFASGCRSTSTNVTGPSSTRCTATLSGTGLTVPGSGGTGTVSVSVNRECSWTAVSEAPWLTITSGATGQGPGTVTFSVPPNPAAVVRRGGIAVGAQRVEVQQEPAVCTYAVTPVSATIAAPGGVLRFTVTTLSGCAWTASTAVPWASIAAGASGSGSGEVAVDVSPNTGAPRSATLTIAGLAVTVAQGGPACSYSVSLSASSFTAQGGTASIVVATLPGCEWSVSSDQPWVTFPGGTTGSGAGTVGFAVAPNPGATRTAVLVVAGQGFTISQASAQSACSFSVSPASRSVGGDGGSGSFEVTTAPGCQWTATSNVSWLSITSGATGSGSGTVTFSAAFNSGSARSGTLSIAGETVTVNQAATTCSFAVSPTTVALPAAGGTTSLSVSTGPTCTWTATSQASWLTLTSGASGTGNGAVSFTAAPNDGSTREGTLTVAGQTVTVTQSGGACTYAIAPTSLSIGSSGGSATVSVSTSTGCAWTATSTAPWIVVTAGTAGTGAGTVQLTIAENTGAARTGTVTIAGQSFVVSQAAAAVTCSYTISPVALVVPAAGGSVGVTVTTQASCAWTATSNAPWITVASGASGTGTGSVTLTVAANAGTAAREGTATIAGQTLTLSQAGAACTYALSPTSASVGASSGTSTVDVSTAPGCAWTAVSGAAWLSLVSGTSGSGSGRVTYAYLANVGPQPRQGTLTIAGLSFTVTQAGVPCSYDVSPTTLNAASTPGTATVSINTASGCAWTATSNATWLQITSAASGTGPGTVTISILQNTTGSARSGTLTVAGQTVTVNQQ